MTRRPALSGAVIRASRRVLANFISPDSIVPNPANPQSLNRYAALANNPLKFTDPPHDPAGSQNNCNHAGSGCDAWTDAYMATLHYNWTLSQRYTYFSGPAVPARNIAPGPARPRLNNPTTVSTRPPARYHSPGPERGDDPRIELGARLAGYEGETSGTIADYDLVTYRTRIQGRAQYKFGPFDNESGNHITNENLVAGGAQVSYGGTVEVAAITMPAARIGPWKLTHQLFVGFSTWRLESWKQYLGYEAVFTLSTDTVAGEFKTGIKQEFESRPVVQAGAVVALVGFFSPAAARVICQANPGLQCP